MRALTTLLSLSLLCLSSVAHAETPTPKSDEDKAFYALGAMLGKNIDVFSLNERELSFVMLGLSETVNGKSREELMSFQEKLRDIAKTRMEKKSAANNKKGAQFLAQEAAKPGATKSETGLVMTTITEGKGAMPKATDKVKVHYRGTLLDGTEFDSSFKRKRPAEFPLNRVIPCWTEGVQKMKVGGKARLVCPAKIAYGERGTPGIPPNSTLIFEVELLEIMAPDFKKPAVKKPAMKGSAVKKITAKPVIKSVKKTVAKPAKKIIAKPVKKTIAKPVKKIIAKPVPVKKTVAKPAK